MMFLSKQLMKHINHKQHFTSIHLIIAHDIAEILLKLVLNTNHLIIGIKCLFVHRLLKLSTYNSTST